MSPKLLACLASVILVAGALLLAPPKGLEPSTSTPAQGTPLTEETIVNHFNNLRGGDLPLIHDPELSTWIAEIVDGTDLHRRKEITADDLLNKLRTEMAAISTASAGVFQIGRDAGPSIEHDFGSWKAIQDLAYTSAGLCIRPLGPEEDSLVWALLVRRLPAFRPELLTKGLQQFHHVCARCDATYNGQFFGGDRILLLECPTCQQRYDILAVNTEGNYQRANTYFSHLDVPGVYPSDLSKRQEMILIWKYVLSNYQYRNDFDASADQSPKDSWQSSAETLERRSGDCEDTSILLADWLHSRGIETRVVIGETDTQEGHAWCLAKIDNAIYLLETTFEKETAIRFPPLATNSGTYRPEYLFDREHLYFFRGHTEAELYDFWNEALWEPVAYEAGSPTFAEASSSSPAEPWFSADPTSVSVSNVGRIVSANASSDEGSASTSTLGSGRTRE